MGDCKLKCIGSSEFPEKDSVSKCVSFFASFPPCGLQFPAWGSLLITAAMIRRSLGKEDDNVSFPVKGKGCGAGAASGEHCGILQLSVILICSAIELTRITGMLKAKQKRRCLQGEDPRGF